ncbi:MAG: leucine-rich repeat protein [Lachnospiraceae bacterium]|nr:leucine-rich repeat protein [Lachnospiraceae bacterium]
MSKKASVNGAKKSKRRLKRSVRRSIAALLMVTAIGVAAIPVPENFAEEPGVPGANGGGTTTGNFDVHESYKYPSDRTEEELKKHPMPIDEQSTVGGSSFGLNWHLLDDSNPNGLGGTDKDGMLDMDKLVKNLYGTDNLSGKVFQSLKVNNLGQDQSGNDQWDLGWQFMYYVVKPPSREDQGVLCKYNSQYRAEEVDLNLTPNTGYYTVEASKYDGYFNGTQAGLDGMNNNPTVELTYTYDNWSKNEQTTAVREAIYFFENYYKDAYDSKLADFQKYKEEAELYKQDPEKNPAPNANLITPLSVKPSDALSETTADPKKKLTYYCEHDKTLLNMGKDYSLVPVIDSRISSASSTVSGSDGNSGNVYVARGGTPVAPYKNDENGFLVTSVGVKMCAIGEQAFYNVNNVDVLTIPSQIGYIGDNSFLHSFIKEIEIVSVNYIGNRAFKDCTQLAKVTIQSGTSIIGSECFKNSALAELTLPYTVNTIGWGAFADCNKMATLNLNGITENCEVKEAAFYNCTALNSIAMSDSAISKIGDAVFAVGSGANPIDITLPQRINSKDGLGDYLFAGRASLGSVVFPKDYGRTSSTAAKLPDNMFHGCVNLQYVEFPVDTQSNPYACGYVSYTPDKLFRDVINGDFYVRGPEKNESGADADPRTSTYDKDAKTAVNDFIPYVFRNKDGVDCYEVAIDGYRYQANEKGELTACVIVGDKAECDGNIVIPAKVGNYPIKDIVPGCFDNADLRETIKTITIEDNSINNIEIGVFKGLPSLKQVIIGNSVESIGDNAFADCKSLIDVTFHTPAAGYANFKVGTDAFKTGGDELTFHGDIVKGYAPFDWAMKPENMINPTTGMRICYKSLTPTYLTVMYDANTELVTLLDYPKYDQIDDILNETHKLDVERFYGDDYVNQKYEDMMADTYYNIYRSEAYDTYRANFAAAWKAAESKSEAEAIYNDTALYGPWVYPQWALNPDNFVTSGSAETEHSNQDDILGKAADFFFEPIVAYAYTGTPEPYFTHFPYSAQDNSDSDGIFNTVTEEERGLINAAKNVVIPEGVESIDVYGYIKGSDANRLNASTYLTTRIPSESYNMYTSKAFRDDNDNTEVVPGLFSGYYEDKISDETYSRGNDRVETVTLNGVKSLPDHAFDSCERLTAVIIGAACSDIGVVPFRGCTSLTNVNFNGNPKYVADNGIIYSRDAATGETDGYAGTYTIEECLYARGKSGGVGSTTIPDASYSSESGTISQVQAIRAGAFEECVNITNVYLNEAVSLTEIPIDCFRNCSTLNRLWLPRTVNNIEEGAFAYDNNLTELRIPGKEVFISARAFVEHTESGKTVNTSIYTYPDSSARRYADKYGSEYLLEYVEIPDEWTVIFLDPDGIQIGNTIYKENGSYLQMEEIPAAPEKEGWVFQKWLSTNQTEVTSPITADTVFIAQGYSANGMVDGEHYTVDFYDQIDGSQIGTTQLILPGGAAIAPQAPTHDGYTFVGWSSEEYLNVQKNLSILAMYSGSGTGGGDGGNGGGTGSGDGNGGSGSGAGGSGSSTTTPLGTSTSTTSSSSASGKYTVTVINGSGSGTYEVGSTVIVSANTPATGKVFSKWTTDSESVKLASVSMSATTFVMPASNVTVTANFINGSAINSVNGTVNNGTTTGRNPVTGNGSTRVDITKPGISNKDLATANVNGSPDNFVVKISETNEATQAVINALTNKYGNMDSILYYAMDISLYDSTGTVKITDTTGLSVDITIPIPDALTVFGGNNMAGAVIANSQLEDLSERFTTINGVPCISFTATHFSPYTIYVNTQNLSEGMLDITPKTGDPIHPKWFLSLGLACLSVILFMKKDKKPVTVKAA